MEAEQSSGTETMRTKDVDKNLPLEQVKSQQDVCDKAKALHNLQEDSEQNIDTADPLFSSPSKSDGVEPLFITSEHVTAFDKSENPPRENEAVINAELVILQESTLHHSEPHQIKESEPHTRTLDIVEKTFHENGAGIAARKEPELLRTRSCGLLGEAKDNGITETEQIFSQADISRDEDQPDDQLHQEPDTNGHSFLLENGSPKIDLPQLPSLVDQEGRQTCSIETHHALILKVEEVEAEFQKLKEEHTLLAQKFGASELREQTLKSEVTDLTESNLNYKNTDDLRINILSRRNQEKLELSDTITKLEMEKVALEGQLKMKELELERKEDICKHSHSLNESILGFEHGNSKSRDQEAVVREVARITGCNHDVCTIAELLEALHEYNTQAAGTYEVAALLQEEVEEELKTSDQLAVELKESKRLITELTNKLELTKTNAKTIMRAVTSRLQEAQDLNRRLAIGASAAGAVAGRALTDRKQWLPGASQAREAGNKAAHGGDILRDAALYSTGHLPKKYKIWFRTAYGIDVDQFLGSYDKLLSLQRCKNRTTIQNFYATIHAGLFRNMQLETTSTNRDSFMNDFERLVDKWRCIENEEREKRYVNQEARDQGFESRLDVSQLRSDMKTIVDGYLDRRMGAQRSH